MNIDEILSVTLKSSFVFSSLLSSKIMECLCSETDSTLFFLSSDPLFSCIVTFYTLILIYLPHHFSKIFFSPVLILTATLLLTILRLGATQKSQTAGNKGESECKLEDSEEKRTSNERREETKPADESKQPSFLEEVHVWITHHSEAELSSEIGYGQNPCVIDSFVEWNVKAPLEVIYEQYEGEEAEDESNGKEGASSFGIERYPSLSLYYPETDSDSSSDCGFPLNGKWESPEDVCFRWEEEDREGLIEIDLDATSNDHKKKTNMDQFHAEEENLIEIDISPTRYDEITCGNSVFG